MGVSPSSSCHESVSCHSVCSCFTNDKNVMSKNYIRSISSKWIWSKQHNCILTQCLTTDSYTMPTDIISMVKDYSFSTKHHHSLSESIISAEKCYSKPEKLLSKKLCSGWFRAHCSVSNPFTIGLISKDSKQKQQIKDGFAGNESSLPSLSLISYNPDETLSSESVTRTLLIDDCPVSVRLLYVDHNTIKKEKKNVHAINLYLVVLNKDDDIFDIDRIIQDLPIESNVILVETNDKSALRATHRRQLCTNHNISFIKESLNCDNSIYDMFIFAVKYYWFCSVYK